MNYHRFADDVVIRAFDEDEPDFTEAAQQPRELLAGPSWVRVFAVQWGWDGTLHFMQTDDRLAPSRASLKSLIKALQAPDRLTMLSALRTAAASIGFASKL